jgi:ribulose-phosphate 3-epimerase
LHACDFVVLMSVNPGFGGQSFLPHVLDKARRLSAALAARALPVTLTLDGGVDVGNAAAVVAAGIRTLVAGSAVYGKADPVAAIGELRRAAAGAAR